MAALWDFLKRKGKISMRKLTVLLAMAAVALLLAGQVQAKQILIGGKPLNVFGYFTQGIQYNLGGNHYDTEEDFQALLFNAFVEAEYNPRDDLRLYASGMLTADWIYDVKSGGGAWADKLFDQSSDNLHIDDESWQLLKEAHVTWTPGDFYFRLGKQVVGWGETDGFRLMDQINPIDQRRGFSDVEFETSIIPIWLVRAEYLPSVQLGWLQEFGLEFIFNPNAQFIPNQGTALGNDAGGIWAPNVKVPLGGPYPYDYAHMGSAVNNIQEPDNWNSDGFEYGLRLKGVVLDAIVTLNFFSGLANDPVLTMDPGPPGQSLASDGRGILHPTFNGKYPRFQFVGATYSKDLLFLNSSALGGVSPVLRLETLYAFDSTFATSNNTTEKHDEWRTALGLDWKVKIPLLNPRAYFTISPQVYLRHIQSYPSAYEISNIEEDNWVTTMMITTSYLHNKLTPTFFWMRDFTTRSNMIRLQLTYAMTYQWSFTVGALLFNGQDEQKGFDLFDNKDYVYFKISFKWG